MLEVLRGPLNEELSSPQSANRHENRDNENRDNNENRDRSSNCVLDGAHSQHHDSLTNANFSTEPDTVL